MDMKNGLVKVSTLIPDAPIEIWYATDQNFTGRAVYPPHAELYLVRGAAERLKKVQKRLKRQHLGLKLFDGYRPLAIQKKFWELVPDPRYVADPKVGSKHNRGAAIDLTLVDQLGRELPMPSAFDEFTERAHRDFTNCPAEERRNRQILEEAMVAEGFLPFPTEWWHFDDPDWASYPILDLSFEELL
jgi:D-alanyl-D-alanine dipeptidase